MQTFLGVKLISIDYLQELVEVMSHHVVAGIIPNTMRL